MMNFFKKIFGKNPETPGLQGNILKLYFDRSKTNFLDINLVNENSLAEVFEKNKEEIFKKINDKVVIQKNDYCFVLIDEDSPLTELKLKLIDSPYRFMKRRANLYYLNINEKEKQLENERPFQNELKKNIYCDDCIREGEILKYSKKIQKFKKKTMILNKEKLILQDNKSKSKKFYKQESNIISLIDIKSVRHVSFNKEKYPFEIETYDYEKYIFASKALSDQESWIEAILSQKTLISDNKCINDYSSSIGKHSRDIYEREKRIIDMCYSLKELVALGETRTLVLEHINDPLLTSLLTNYYSYMANMRKYKYGPAKEFALNIISQVLFNEGYYEDIIRKEQEEAKELELKIKDMSSNNSLRRGSNASVPNLSIINRKNIKERFTLYNNQSNEEGAANKVELKLNEKISQIVMRQISENSQSNDQKKRLSDENGPKSTSKLPDYKLSSFTLGSPLDAKTPSFNDETSHIRKISNFEDPTPTEVSPLRPEIKLSELSLKKLDRNDYLQEHHKLFLFCPLNSYRVLKNVKIGLERLEQDGSRLGGVNLSDMSLSNSSFISKGSNSSETRGLHEYLKIDIFEEIYESILKYIHKFYYRYLKSAEFKTKLHEIFLHLWKRRNNFDFDDLLTIELPKKNSNSTNDAKMYLSTGPSDIQTMITSAKTSRSEKKMTFDEFMSNGDNDKKVSFSSVNNFHSAKK